MQASSWLKAAMIAVLLVPVVAQAGKKTPSPEKVAGATTVSTEEAKRLFVKGVKFVDVRSYSDWDAGRIPMAYHHRAEKGVHARATGRHRQKG